MNQFIKFPNEKVLLVMALKEESGGLLESHGFSVNYTGIGMVNAASKMTEFVITLKPDRVINLGTAGSFALPKGSLVEVEGLVQRGHVVSFIRDRKKLNPVSDLPKAICGTADFVELEKSASALYQVMDMEALALAQVCDALKVPFNSFKFVTDSSDLNTLNDWRNNLVKAQAEFVKLCQSFNN